MIKPHAESSRLLHTEMLEVPDAWCRDVNCAPNFDSAMEDFLSDAVPARRRDRRCISIRAASLQQCWNEHITGKIPSEIRGTS